MLSKIFSSSLFGMNAQTITVETDVNSGHSSFFMVGLAEGAVREAEKRVTGALRNNGFDFPQNKVTVNLAPADIKKEGSLFDLPLAIGLLISSGQLNPKIDLSEFIIMGELSLDGSLKPVRGVLPMAADAVKRGFCKFLLPCENAKEASLAEGSEVYAIRDIRQAADYIAGVVDIAPYSDINSLSENASSYDVDFCEVKGQQHVKRAMEIAAAGSHNMLMVGSPGSGKTMLARRMPTILPSMSRAESIEVTMLYSAAGMIKRDSPLITKRPFRAVHHTCSPIALVGGGRVPKPGEISLSHAGVLFLDEFAEFAKASLEVLRQPMEDNKVMLSRVNASLEYPADFMLLASMNPCPCGYLNDKRHRCTCSAAAIERYHHKISGPLLDRIDIVANVNVEKFDALTDKESHEETSAVIRARVNAARLMQMQRYENEKILNNSQLSSLMLEKYCALNKEELSLMRAAFDMYDLSARAYHRVLKLARTIADLNAEENINVSHLAEALQYRGMDIHTLSPGSYSLIA